MRRTRVKFCGITRQCDATLAVELGVDALGFVFHPASPRYIEPENAAKIIAALPPFVTTVGLVVDLPVSEVEVIIGQTKIDLIQFHGDEAPALCRAISRPYVKAIRVQKNLDLTALAEQYHGAQGILLDAYVAGQPGGTGQRFDWADVPPALPVPLIIAGGLDQDNVIEAIRRFEPHGVDVSSGIEQQAGIKDENKMHHFMTRVNQVHG